MKTFTNLSIYALFILFTFEAVAQNAVSLDIHHMLFDTEFELDQETKTPEGEAFKVSRLEYYISEIKVTHDGGQVTQFNDVWLLVNATETGPISLGTEDIQSVESIAFSIGVDPDHNHLDPAAWPAEHPLAPKNPSMHWGWTSGYRFVAMEGEGGDELNQDFQIHALEDVNYFETSIDVSATAANGELVIDLYANYPGALKGLDPSTGLINHGGTGEAVTLLENFRDHVFFSEMQADTVPGDTTTNVNTVTNSERIIIAPNPATNGQVRVLLDNQSPDRYDVEAFTISGKAILIDLERSAGRLEVSGLEPGFYFIRVVNLDSGTETIKKVSVY